MKQTFTLALMALCLSFTFKTMAQTSEIIGYPDPFLLLNGNIQDSKVTLTWEVSKNEIYNLFEVEKSNDGKEFTAAGIVFTSDKAGTENYLYKNSVTPDQFNYYRLKLVTNHNVAYSNIIAVKTSSTVVNHGISLRQNPVQEQLSFNYNSLMEAAYNVSIYNAGGVKVYSTMISCYKGANTINLKTSGLTKGTYILEIKSNYSQSTTRFIKI